MLLTAHLRLQGWSTYYLGSSLPISDVRLAAERLRPDIVCISFMDKHAIDSSLSELTQFGCAVAITGFGALTFDAEESLAPQLKLLKRSGREAASAIENLVKVQ